MRKSKKISRAESTVKQLTGCQEDKEYLVGYGRPPVATRFKKGCSANPKGRPKKKQTSRDFEQTFRSVFDEKVQVRIDGKMRTMNGVEAAFWQLKAQVLAGDARAFKMYFDICKIFRFSDKDSSNAQLEGLFSALMAGPAEGPPYRR